jgi:hypothetical protein
MRGPFGPLRCMCTCMHACEHACARVHVCACACACVCAYVCMHRQAHVCVHLHARMHVCAHVYICMWKKAPAYIAAPPLAADAWGQPKLSGSLLLAAASCSAFAALSFPTPYNLLSAYWAWRSRPQQALCREAFPFMLTKSINFAQCELREALVT